MTGQPTMTPADGSGTSLDEVRAELERVRDRLQRLEQDLTALTTAQSAGGRPGVGRVLRQAAARGDWAVVGRLLSGGGVDVNARNKAGATALFLAVHVDGNDDVVRLLLAAGADPNRSDSAGTTPLTAAVRPEQIGMVRLLVEAGASIDVANRDGDTPLTNAAAWGSEPVVSYLIERGADPKRVDGVGITATDLAQQQGHSRIADLLATAAVRR